MKHCRLGRAFAVALSTLVGVVFLIAGAAFLHAGTIAGEVTFVGPVPSSKPIQVSKDQDYCGSTLPDHSLLVGSGRELKNVVVYLDVPGFRPTPSGKANFLDTDGCSFVPRVSAMLLGEKLIIRNNDPKLHIVHSYLDKQTVFNIAVPFPGHQMEITHKIKKPGMLQVNCDTHAWMRGYIHVFDHSYFAVTDDRGSFAVSNVPAGVYTLKAWHEKGGLQSMEVTVPEAGEVRVNVEVGRWQ
jgi:hypothetical protein